MLDFILNRLREPSTYAGLAALAMALGLSMEEYEAVAAVLMAAAGAVAVFLREKK